MSLNVIRLTESLARFSDHWRPKIVATLNGQDVKLVKCQGEFVWHTHHDVDELFLVIHGQLRVELRTATYTLGPGELAVVPRGVEHRTVAEDEAHVLIFEPAGVLNTGDVVDPQLTAPSGVRL